MQLLSFLLRALSSETEVSCLERFIASHSRTCCLDTGAALFRLERSTSIKVRVSSQRPPIVNASTS